MATEADVDTRIEHKTKIEDIKIRVEHEIAAIKKWIIIETKLPKLPNEQNSFHNRVNHLIYAFFIFKYNVWKYINNEISCSFTRISLLTNFEFCLLVSIGLLGLCCLLSGSFLLFYLATISVSSESSINNPKGLCPPPLLIFSLFSMSTPQEGIECISLLTNQRSRSLRQACHRTEDRQYAQLSRESSCLSWC